MTEVEMRRNVRLYGWIKIFTKRVFLPLLSIYLVEVGGVSLAQLGVIIFVSGLVTLVAQVPTGFFADKRTRRGAMLLGATFLILGTVVLAIWPSFEGGLVSTILSAIGYSFNCGAAEALMHDSLDQCGKGKAYLKEMGRAQSKGLVGNVILVGLVPLTYGINPRLPFTIGVLAFGLLCALCWALVEPPLSKAQQLEPNRLKQLVIAARTFANRNTVWLFLAIGLSAAFYGAGTDYNSLVLKDLGMAARFVGFAFAAGSLVGALFGYFVHHIEKLSFRTFAMSDAIICSGFFIVVGLSRNLLISIAAVTLSLGFWRLRYIIYQHYLFNIFNGSSYKATLMSLISFCEQMFTLLLPSIFVFWMTRQGYYWGYAIIGVTAAVILGVLFIVAFMRLKVFFDAREHAG